MRFWKPEPVVEPSHDPVAIAHETALREAYLRGRRDERARHRNSPMIAAAFGLAGLMGATLLVGSVLRSAYQAERDVSFIAAQAQAASPAPRAALSAGATQTADAR